ncbi:MAG TPA: amidohydrolase family protein [Chloroflexota bacterium]|nr:amidohydrolase family protein [Chloroflexota bacterium]
MVIIDSQVHIWAPDNPMRPRPPLDFTLFPPGEIHDQEPLDRVRLLKQMDAAGVDKAILVPPLWEGHRNDLAIEAAVLHPDRFAIMGKLPMHAPEYSLPRLADWRRIPGMLGLRLAFTDERDRPMLADGSLDWLWPEAERLGIPIMLLPPRQLHHVAVVAARFPGLKLVIDHLGVTRLQDRDLDATLGPSVALARYPNVAIKLSGLPCFSSEPYPFRNIHEAVRRVVEAYGPHRCFWGTDLTRLLLKCSYREAVTMVTEEMDFLSEIDKEWIMGRGLAAWLDWS